MEPVQPTRSANPEERPEPWHGVVNALDRLNILNARDILAESGGDPEARSERDEAAWWLREYLVEQGSSAKAAEIIKAARADGITEATLKRARKRAGIATTRQGFGQGSAWTLDL